MTKTCLITAGLPVITRITPRDVCETGHRRADYFILSVYISDVTLAFAAALSPSNQLGGLFKPSDPHTNGKHKWKGRTQHIRWHRQAIADDA
ncbi:MAG: hypothetical protein Tsb002_38170 [Wenzhouxiangellaceae bacterium]